MTGLPTSLSICLSIALSLVGSTWLVAVAGHVLGAPAEIIYIALGAGVVAGIAEWIAIERLSR
jgi:hypothetical protein